MSWMNTTSNFTSSLEIPVSWSGNDTVNGSGIASYNIYVSENHGVTWLPWLNQTTETNATFTGLPGAEYSFRSQAIDRAGNIEGESSEATPGIKIDTSAPNGTVNGSIPDITTINVTLRFADPDSGIQHLEYRVGTADGLEDVVPATVTNVSDFRITDLDLQEGYDYYITARATNWANLTSDWISSGPIMAPPGISDLTLSYPDLVLITETIPIVMASNSTVTDWDLEVNSSPYYDGNTNDWSGWQEVGAGDGGDGAITSYVGERGRVYAFRLRVKFAGTDWSPYLEPSNRTRLNRAPTGSITLETKDPTVGKKVSFEAHVGDNDGDAITYSWDYGDGKEDAEPQGTIADHVYDKAGTYTLTLSITDGHEWTNVTLEVTVKKSASGSDGLGGKLLWILLAVIIIVVVVILLLLFAKRKEGGVEAEHEPMEGPKVELDDEERALLEDEGAETGEVPEDEGQEDLVEEPDVEEEPTHEKDDLDELLDDVEAEEEARSDAKDSKP
jgi:hypothetical protein